MARDPKKRTAKSRRTEKASNENLTALFFIFFGIFIALSVRTNSMGVVGSFIKYILLGLFSKLSLLISFVLIFLGIYKLIYSQRLKYKDISKLMVGLASLSSFLLYGIANHRNFPKSTPLSVDSTRLIMSQAQTGEGSGLISTAVSYYFSRLFGIYGTVLIASAIIIFVSVFYFKLDPSKLMSSLKKFFISSKSSIAVINKKILSFIMIDEKKERPLKKNSSNSSRKSSGKKAADIIKSEKNYEFPIEEYQDKDNDLLKRDLKNDYTEPDSASGFEDIKTKTSLMSVNNKTDSSEVLPGLDLLTEYDRPSRKESSSRQKNSRLLEETLLNFGVEATVKNISHGPVITRYELEPASGTKVSKITNLTEDLALALAAQSIRIEAPIPGKSLIGIEIPNDISEMVTFRQIASNSEFTQTKASIAFGIGKDIGGRVIVADIASMPHLLIAGATGSGKSVCVNTLICSILYKYTSDQVKMIMIDPKMVELSIYNGIPHLLIPVVTDMKKAPNALNWAVAEMNKRYKLFAENKVKDLDGYNKKQKEQLPRIIILVDELADLMMVSPNEVEDAICRLAQMARACGMHLVLATQRPSVDVITGLIKSNIPSRISFAVSSATDSRTILDTGGAEKLLGKGDMLYYPMGYNKPVRLQGAFISEQEVTGITDYLRSFNTDDDENDKIRDEIEQLQEISDNPEDPLMTEILDFITENQQASTSLLQRKFRIGYNRASRIIDQLEEKGIIGKSDGARPRKVLIENAKQK